MHQRHVYSWGKSWAKLRIERLKLPRKGKYSYTIILSIESRFQLEGENIPSSSKGRDKKSKKTEKDKIEFKETKKLLTSIVTLEIIIILLLALNILLMSFNLFSEGAVVNAGDGIELEGESTGENTTEYNVKLKLENTGDVTAKVSITGEVYVSEMGSTWGEEVYVALDYKYVEIAPEETKDLDLGTFTSNQYWHHTIKVHIGWNGGSLELTEILVP